MTMRPRALAPAALTAAALLIAAAPLPAQTWRTMTSARQLQGQKQLGARISYGAGTLRVEPAAAGTLYRMELRYDEETAEPISDFDAASSTVRLGVRSREGRSGRGVHVGEDGARATIALAANVPTTLKLEFGAADAALELGGMTLRSLDISTGASKTELVVSKPNRIAASEVKLSAGAASFRASGLGNLRAQRYHFSGGVGETVLDFGGAWDRSASAEISMGMGSLTLRFPRSIGVRVVRESSFLTRFSPAGLVQREGGYYSANWERAAHRLTVNVGAAFGSVNIEWID
jgi:hypothetical protein